MVDAHGPAKRCAECERSEGTWIMRTSIQALNIGTVALLLAMGCENAADQQRKANEAQTEANEKSLEARADADRAAREAQLDANREISAAQEKFSKLREDFRHDMRDKLTEVDKEIADLRSQSSVATGKKKEKIVANLPIIDERRALLDDAFRRLDQASATSWDEAKGEVEKRWDELKHSVKAAT
jgi:small-conductance mechanosensitive channel